MQCIILCVGIPASGKTTWAKKQIQNNPLTTLRVNMDDLRVMMYNYNYSKENEQLIFKAKDYIIFEALKAGKNVIIDDCNIHPQSFTRAINIVRDVGIVCEINEKSFYVSLDEAIRRNSLREGSANIPNEAIIRMWEMSGRENHQFYRERRFVAR